MATLYFKVSSDYDEVIRLRQECEKLEAQLKKMDVNKSPAAAKALEMQLASTRQQMMGLVTEAAKAGAVMENDLKKKLNSASRASDELTEEIIKQRKIIRDTQDDVRRLSDEYSKMGKYSPNSNVKLAELNRAKAALNEQRYAMGELQDQQARNRLEVRKLTREYKEFANGTNNADEIVKSLTDSLKRTAAEIGGLVAIKKFGSDVIEATGKMQQLQVALSTILQDKTKADQLIAEIVQFAAKTPFNLDDVAEGAKQLLAYGSSADNVVNELSMLGDVASGLQIPIGQLIYLYGTLRTQGRAMTVDIRQFAGRGIPIYEELAKVLGVSKDQVGELVKEGKVGFKEVEQAFKNMTSEGGKFANLMENSAGTWPQRLSNIEDTLFQKMNDFGNKYKEVFEFGIGTAEELVEGLDDVLSVMGGLIAAYGTYKAALIATAVAQKAVGFIESIRLISMYRKEMGLATAAQQAFNVASKSNVYVALLSALVGIGTAIYMFTKRTDEATAAQEALNSVNKKADDEFAKQAATIDRLSNVLQSETSSLDQKKKALTDLQSIIPSYNASLDEEGKLINNNTEAIKAYLTQLEKQIRMKAAQEELEELYRNKRLQEKEVQSKYTNYETIKSHNPIGVVYGGDAGVEAQRHALNRISSAEKALNKANKELEKTQSQIKALEKEIEQSSLSDKKTLPRSTISKEITNTTKRIKILRKEISGLRNGSIKADAGKTVEDTIEAKNKELQAAEKTLETLTGKFNKTTPKTENKRKKSVEQQKKAQEELNKDLLSLQQQNQDDEIALLQDGTQKKLAEINNDYEKRKSEIDRLEAEFRQRNKEARLKALGLDGLTDGQSVALQKARDLAAKEQESRTQEVYAAEVSAMRDYLKEYGTFLQQKLAITEEYAEKIKHAQNEGDRLTLERERDKAISDVNLSAIKQNIDWAGVFGNLGTMFREEMERSLESLRIYMRSDEFKSMEPENQAKIVEAVNNLKGNISGDLTDVDFKKIGELTIELQNAQRKMITAYSAEVVAYDNLKKAQENYRNAMESGTAEQKAAAKANLDAAQTVADNMSQAYKQAVGEFNATGNNLKEATDCAVDAINSISSAISQIRSNSLSGAYEGTQQLTETLGKSLSGFEGLLGKTGNALSRFSSSLGGATGEIVSAALGLLDLLKDGFGSIFADLSDLMFNAVNGILDDLLSGGIITKPLQSVVDGVSNILNTITFGGFNSWLGGNDKDVMEAVNRLTDSNKYLQESIDRLSERIGDESNTADQTLGYYITAKDAEEQWRENQQKIIKNLASAWTNTGYGFLGLGGKGSFNGHAPDSNWSGWDSFSETLKNYGFDVTLRNSEDFWELTPEQMELLRDNNPKEWQKLFDSDGHKNPIDAVDEYIEHAGKLEELTDVLNENLTKISFDSLYDNFIDTLMDMDASAEDFADNMSEYFMRAALSEKVGALFKTRLNNWYNDFASAMEDGTLDDNEIDALRNDYENIVKDAMAERDDLANIIGYTGSSKEQQSATAKGFETMSQDTAEELNGRFTSVYESNLRIETAEQQQTVAITELRGSISALTAQASGMYNIADETRTILANSYLELQQIRENTGEIIKPIKQIQADMAEVKRNTSRL